MDYSICILNGHVQVLLSWASVNTLQLFSGKHWGVNAILVNTTVVKYFYKFSKKFIKTYHKIQPILL